MDQHSMLRREHGGADDSGPRHVRQPAIPTFVERTRRPASLAAVRGSDAGPAGVVAGPPAAGPDGHPGAPAGDPPVANQSGADSRPDDAAAHLNIEREIDLERTRTLSHRVRVIGWTAVAIVAMFLFVNSIVRTGPAAPYFALLLAAFAVLSSFVAFSYRPGFVRHQSRWTILTAAALAGLAAEGSVLQGDISITATVLIMVMLTTAAVLPWGIARQAALAGICGAITIAAAIALGTRATGDAGMIMLVNVAAGSLLSLVVAWQNHGAFELAVRENLRLRAAEEGKRMVNEELEAMVRARTAELEGALADQRDMTRAISHDLRQPLRHIEGYARMIEDDLRATLDRENLDRLDRVRAATVRTGRMVDSLLELSRVSGRLLQRSRFDLSACAAVLRDDILAAEPHRRADFVIAPAIAEDCDPDLTRNLLRELFANAWKFTREQPNARIEFGRRGDALFVRDNGAGFDMRYTQRLFHAFERLHHAAEFDGDGMGLAIAERIVRSHGGRIWAESEPGHGATFLFTLRGRA